MIDTPNEIKAPYLKFKMFLLENDIKHKDVAKLLGINPALFSQKINKKNSNFSLDEASVICAKYGLDLHEYFFNENFSIMRNGEGTT